MEHAVILDPRSSDSVPAHPGNPSREQVLAPLVSRFVHPLYPGPLGVTATFWNPESGADEDVRILQVLHEPADPADAPVFVLVGVGERYLAVQASLLCENRDGAPVPRYRLARVALWNASAERALVFDADGARYEVEQTGNNEALEAEASVVPMREGLHIGMWIQPADSSLVELDADPHPFSGLCARVREQRVWSLLLQMFVTAVDPRMGASLRSDAAKLFGEAERAAGTDLWERFAAAVARVRPCGEESFFDVVLPGRGVALVRAIAERHGIPVPKDYPLSPVLA